ncbi:hypothetical protein ICW40_11995 [Actinotalea ferrariae]|uniref:hypothetical protein n=1 Tax=Actinotalea ferrariae TaxID=1386098 RepID=UPI001C8CAD9B|nr:hypothetical protein [Actinotalea ferrariae]MBX9245524.1 hypothetical protein [Actinotalea ferrariae]
MPDARTPQGGDYSDTTLRLRRFRFLILGSIVLLLGVAGVIAGAVTGGWTVTPSSALLAVAGGLVVWLSRWLPSPTAHDDPLQKRALVVILAVLVCIVGGALLFGALTGN